MWQTARGGPMEPTKKKPARLQRPRLRNARTAAWRPTNDGRRGANACWRPGWSCSAPPATLIIGAVNELMTDQTLGHLDATLGDTIEITLTLVDSLYNQYMRGLSEGRRS